MPEVSDLSLQLGKYIQTARDARGLTQEKVGEMIGRTGKSISNIARGKTNPKFDLLYDLFRALDIDVTALFYGGHNLDSSTLEQFHRLLDGCTEEELEMLLDISRSILSHTRMRDEIKPNL